MRWGQAEAAKETFHTNTAHSTRLLQQHRFTRRSLLLYSQGYEISVLLMSKVVSDPEKTQKRDVVFLDNGLSACMSLKQISATSQSSSGQGCSAFNCGTASTPVTTYCKCIHTSLTGLSGFQPTLLYYLFFFAAEVQLVSAYPRPVFFLSPSLSPAPLAEVIPFNTLPGSEVHPNKAPKAFYSSAGSWLPIPDTAPLLPWNTAHRSLL